MSTYTTFLRSIIDPSISTTEPTLIIKQGINLTGRIISDDDQITVSDEEDNNPLLVDDNQDWTDFYHPNSKITEDLLVRDIIKPTLTDNKSSLGTIEYLDYLTLYQFNNDYQLEQLSLNGRTLLVPQLGNYIASSGPFKGQMITRPFNQVGTPVRIPYSRRIKYPSSSVIKNGLETEFRQYLEKLHNLLKKIISSQRVIIITITKVGPLIDIRILNILKQYIPEISILSKSIGLNYIAIFNPYDSRIVHSDQVSEKTCDGLTCVESALVKSKLQNVIFHYQVDTIFRSSQRLNATVNERGRLVYMNRQSFNSLSNKHVFQQLNPIFTFLESQNMGLGDSINIFLSRHMDLLHIGQKLNNSIEEFNRLLTSKGINLPYNANRDVIFDVALPDRAYFNIIEIIDNLVNNTYNLDQDFVDSNFSTLVEFGPAARFIYSAPTRDLVVQVQRKIKLSGNKITQLLLDLIIGFASYLITTGKDIKLKYLLPTVQST